MAEPMRALTVKQPYASAIIFGEKDVENRTWAHRYRGLLAIHAGKGVDWGASWEAWCAAGLLPPPILRRPRFNRSAWTNSLSLGAIIGTATLAIIHHESTEEPRNSCSPWGMPGQYHWCLINARPLDEPVPCDGKQRLWRLPDEVEKAVREQIGRDIPATPGGECSP